ncbi:MAG: gamma-glutamylcyclotransferase [Oscillospiraceae bacterium]|nr:gamma-glutamylcyclotransferase [Oscillospiraceae bacterium]
MGKLYIAYGSNLNLAQMAARCPYASIYAKGVLNNWELVYRGSKTNSHATIIKKQGSTVSVLVWEIQPYDEYRLDIYEGYPHYYFKKDIMVDIDGKKKKAMVYIMNQKQLPGKPSIQYINTIRQGYIDNNMDVNIFEKSLEKNSIECA